jgi:hypothetical protein
MTFSRQGAKAQVKNIFQRLQALRPFGVAQDMLCGIRLKP